MNTFMAGTLTAFVVLSVGCTVTHEPSLPTHTMGKNLYEACESLLSQEMDTGTSEGMRKIDAEYERFAETYGERQLAQTLESIADGNIHLRVGACSRLKRYLKPEEYKTFLQEILVRSGRFQGEWKEFVEREMKGQDPGGDR